MNKINLHDAFIKSLHDKIPNKKFLVDRISDILNIEKEPASRRINGKVLFSVQEMGIVAKELGIVIDSLLHQEVKYQWVPILLGAPMSVGNMSDLTCIIENTLSCMLRISQKPTTFGTIFHTLPIELFCDYPYLTKFMFFRWGYYFVGIEEFDDFSGWELPTELMHFTSKINRINVNVQKSLYIWDESLIWTFVREVNYLRKLHIINEKDTTNIREELKYMLDQLEKCLKLNSYPTVMGEEVRFYFSNVNVGITSLYFSSDDQYLSTLQTSFSFSRLDESYENFRNIKSWVDSFKNISTLISGSGSLERRQFFRRQHRIIDLFLTHNS